MEAHKKEERKAQGVPETRPVAEAREGSGGGGDLSVLPFELLVKICLHLEVQSWGNGHHYHSGRIQTVLRECSYSGIF